MFTATVGTSTIPHTYVSGGTVKVGFTTNIFPDKDPAFIVESIVNDNQFAIDVGISDIQHNYVQGGTFQKFDRFLFGSQGDDPDFIYLDGLSFNCPSGQTAGLTTTVFPTDQNKIAVVFPTDPAHIKVNVGVSTFAHIYVGGGSLGEYTPLNIGSGYNGTVSVLVEEEGHAGAAASIIGVPGPGGELQFNIIDGGTGYSEPYTSVPSPNYFNLPAVTVQRRSVAGIPTAGEQGKNLFITCDVGAARTTAIGRSEYYEVNNFELTNLGYAFELGDVLEVVGLVTAKGLSQPIEPFRVTVDEIFNDNFGAWTFGEQDYIDSIKDFQDGIRLRFPLNYKGKSFSFEQNINDEDSAAVDLDSILMIYVDTVLQVPGVDYTFDGGSSFEFSSAPLPQENIDIYFYRGKRGLDSTIVTDINESIRPGDELQLMRNDANKDNVQTQDVRIVTEIASSDTVRTNIYVGDNDLDSVKARQVAWDKQKRDVFIYGLPVYKTRDTLEPIIKPQSYLIRNASSTSPEMFLSSANLFKYEEDQGNTTITQTDFRIVKTRAEQQEDAELRL